MVSILTAREWVVDSNIVSFYINLTLPEYYELSESYLNESNLISYFLFLVKEACFRFYNSDFQSGDGTEIFS